MRRTFAISVVLLAHACVVLGDPPVVVMGYSIDAVETNATGWQVAGSVRDGSASGFDGLNIPTSGLVVCESIYGDVDSYRFSVVTQTVTRATLLLVYVGTNAAPRVGSPTYGGSLLCEEYLNTGIPLPTFYNRGGPSPYLRDGVAARSLYKLAQLASAVSNSVINAITGITASASSAGVFTRTDARNGTIGTNLPASSGGITGLTASASNAGVPTRTDASNWTIGTNPVALWTGTVSICTTTGLQNFATATFNTLAWDSSASSYNGNIISNKWYRPPSAGKYLACYSIIATNFPIVTSRKDIIHGLAVGGSSSFIAPVRDTSFPFAVAVTDFKYFHGSTILNLTTNDLVSVTIYNGGAPATSVWGPASTGYSGGRYFQIGRIE